MIHLAAFGFLVCACLAVANMGAAAVRFFPIQKWLKFWIDRFEEGRDQRSSDGDRFSISLIENVLLFDNDAVSRAVSDTYLCSGLVMSKRGRRARILARVGALAHVLLST